MTGKEDLEAALLHEGQSAGKEQKHRPVVRGLSGLPAFGKVTRDGSDDSGSGDGDGGTYSHLGDAVEPADTEMASQGDEEAPLLSPGNDGSHSVRGVSWQMATAILLADMFGIGLLTLPSDFARLGWVLGLVVVLTCASAMVFSGLLFTRLSVTVPGAKTFGDFGQAAYGQTGLRLVFAVVYTTILLEPIIFQLTTTESLLQILHSTGVSQVVCGLIVAGVMVPLAQVQGLEEVSWTAILGTVGMLVTVAVAFLKLHWLETPSSRVPMERIHTGNFKASLVAFLDIVFTYGGQVNWVRYITGLKRRQDFKYSVCATSIFMTVIYMGMGVYGYHQLGYDFDHSKPMTSILPYDAWTVVMNVGVLAHCIIAYQINLNVWTDVVLHIFMPSMVTNEARGTTRGRQVWALVTISGIAFSFVAAQTFPFFSTVMAVIASIGDLTAVYALPALFCLKLGKRSMPRWEVVVCYIVIPLTIGLSGVGIFISVQELVSQYIKH